MVSGLLGRLAWRCSFGLWQSLGVANMDIGFDITILLFL